MSANPCYPNSYPNILHGFERKAMEGDGRWTPQQPMIQRLFWTASDTCKSRYGGLPPRRPASRRALRRSGLRLPAQQDVSASFLVEAMVRGETRDYMDS